ncbi:SDR family NAD(P)-dependent oxidoreductase [Williamsia sp. D3]|uniref:SDR family NAD(P)-dependent oxidoreductase n=1 Tax=Williamsia sp. D3 TaxID=1313067 RepID=UPI0003D2A570|nr:SDR family oxidoreductase [Williamsia sp. D3]ETD33697.1 short-chain dehydrogenase [Williamsia sp. D3]
MAEQHLSGKCVVIAGSSRGIGRAVAECLVAEGASVVINGRDGDVASRVAADLRDRGGVAVAVAGSAADDGVAEALIAASIDGFGRLDAVINCAGIAEPEQSSILTMSTADFRAQLDAHLLSTFELARVAAPVLSRQAHGSIVATGSAAAAGNFGGTGYPAAKGGVNGLALALAADLKPHGVRVNVICPGGRTRLSTGAGYEAHIKGLFERGLLDEFTRDAALDPAPPDYVAPLYAYLVSDLASEVTGQIFSAAGGFIGRYPAFEPAFVAYRGHQDEPPYTLPELHGLVPG